VVSFQGSLLAGRSAADSHPPIERRALARGAWLDHAPNWQPGADDLFVRLLGELDWKQRDRPMYGRRVADPRLTVGLDAAALDRQPALAAIAALLGGRYGGTFDSCWLNHYRDGRDSVAWHGDRVARDLDQALVAIVSLGQRRPFLLRPKGGGRSIRLTLGEGDLLVMGGTCQRTWDHSVPKVAQAGPRMSVTFRPEGQSFTALRKG
jgi:alkylated DNA repair dioxygenase AlkB